MQIVPVKINPWSWVAKAIGRAINGEVLAKLGEVEKRLNKHITTDDRRAADGNRTRILHFNNELLRDLKHTKEEFVEVLAEILPGPPGLPEQPGDLGNRKYPGDI